MLDAPTSGTVMPLTTITVSIKAFGAGLGPDTWTAGAGAGAPGRSVVLFVYAQLRAAAASHAYPRTTIECGRTPGGSTDPRLSGARRVTSVRFPALTLSVSHLSSTPPVSTRNPIHAMALASVARTMMVSSTST